MLKVYSVLPRRASILLTSLLIPSIAQAQESVEAPAHGFDLIDWMVVFAYAAILIGVGVFYSRKQTSTEEYFVAGRRLPPFIAGISLYATMFSTLSYIGFPGEMAQNGPVLLCLNVASLPVIYLIVGYLIIPYIMKLRVTSAYELLEERLGIRIRLLGSFLFVATRLVWMTIMLYTTSFVVVTVMGWDVKWITLITIATGIITTVYTLLGGIKAVVITDVLQFFVLLFGAVFTLVFITANMGGVTAWWPDQWLDHWEPQPFFSLDPHVRVTVVGSFVTTIIWWVCTAASDQLAIQRYLSTRNPAAARRAFLHNSIAGATVTCILGLVGLAVIGFYKGNPQFLPAELALDRDGDALFPHFVSHFLPVGIPGLVMSGLMAAAMSSLSSGINSTITVISKDFIDHFRPQWHRSDKARLYSAHILTVAIGVITVSGSQLPGAIPGNLIEVVNKTFNLFLCPMFGLFFLALFVKFATPFGAAMGAFYSFAAAFVVAYWDLLTGEPTISFQWIKPISLVATLVFSCLFSLVPTRGKSVAVLGGCTITAFIPWIVLVWFICR